MGYDDPRKGMYNRSRFETPDAYGKWFNRYQFSSEELQDGLQRTERRVYTEVLDLTVARDKTNPYVITEPGRAVVLMGLNQDTQYDPVTNTGTETVKNTIFAACYFDQGLDDRAFWGLKHGRGFQGDFHKLYLVWPAQSASYARLIIFKWDGFTYHSGDFPA